ncbi:unnamed protein product, partial [Phaeothamnion confervicola]
PKTCIQVGIGFRNEINPRAGLLRVREFCMAEIEHFVNPADKRHVRFHTVADKELVLFGREDQLGSGRTQRMSAGAAVGAGLINNETLGYFMARTQLYLEKIGMDPARMRFRQHLSTEMAHYAADCWDMEIKSSYGWVECVGHADRACFDLAVHAKATGVTLEAAQRLDVPKTVKFLRLETDKKKIGMTFKGQQKMVVAALEELTVDTEAAAAVETQLATDAAADVAGFQITREMAKWVLEEKTVQEERFVPSVVEPSFGVGRILYSLLEHSVYVRPGDEQRVVMRFRPAVAPVKVGVYPLSGQEAFMPLCQRIVDSLNDVDISSKLDASGAAVGRRYSRADEIGIPFGVTVDFESAADNSVTLRERDSMAQVRLPAADVPTVVFGMVRGRTTWADVTEKYPVIRAGDDD